MSHRYQETGKFFVAVDPEKVSTSSFEEAKKFFVKEIEEALRLGDNPDIAFVCYEPYYNFHQFPYGSQDVYEWKAAIETEAEKAGIR